MNKVVALLSLTQASIVFCLLLLASNEIEKIKYNKIK